MQTVFVPVCPTSTFEPFHRFHEVWYERLSMPYTVLPKFYIIPKDSTVRANL
jgi:hypothetical protein